MSNDMNRTSYPEDTIYLLDWHACWANWMDGAGPETGGIHGYNKWIKGLHEGQTPHWLQEFIFSMLDNYPWYCTTLPFNGQTLQEMKDRTPEACAELAQWVRRGRIEVCDGTYDTPYLFLYPGESQIRQFQYGKAATRDVLGVDITKFGSNEADFHPQLAQLLRLLGYEGVMLVTPWGHYGSSPTAEQHRIWWQAPDGTCIDAIPSHPAVYSYDPPLSSLPFGYQENPDVPGWDQAITPHVQKLFASSDIRWPFVCLNGDSGMNKEMYRFALEAVDDTYANDIVWCTGLDLNRRIKALIKRGLKSPFRGREWYEKTNTSPNIRLTTLTEYFNRTDPPEVRKAFTRDEFRYRHISGTYGDRALISGRQAETKLCEAEALAVMVQAAEGSSRSGFLDNAWKKLLQSQHLNNLCIPTEFSWRRGESPAGRGIRQSEEAAREARDAGNETIDFLERQIDTKPSLGDESAAACIVFNPLGWTRSDAVEVRVPLRLGANQSARCYDGRLEVPCQIVKRHQSVNSSTAEVDIVFRAGDVPGFGYKTFHFTAGDSQGCPSKASDLSLENDLLKIEFDAKGHITSCLDHITGREFLDTPSALGNELTGKFPKEGFLSTRSCEVSATVVESGPVRWTLQAKGKMTNCPFTSIVRLAAGSRRIDFSTTFDFPCGTRIGDLTWFNASECSFASKSDGKGLLNAHDKLRTTFNPKLSGEGQFFSDLAFAAYPSNKTDVLGISWADCSDEESGLTLINTGNIAYYRSPENGATLSMVLAYGGPHRAKGPTYLADEHKFRYSLVPHAGDWKAAKSYRYAAEVGSPLITRVTSNHDGCLPPSAGLLEVTPANVVSSALLPGKPAQLRIVEMEGTATTATLLLNAPAKQAQVVDLQGNVIRPAKVSGSTVHIDLRGHEIATIQLRGLRWLRN